MPFDLRPRQSERKYYCKCIMTTCGGDYYTSVTRVSIVKDGTLSSAHIFGQRKTFHFGYLQSFLPLVLCNVHAWLWWWCWWYLAGIGADAGTVVDGGNGEKYLAGIGSDTGFVADTGDNTSNGGNTLLPLSRLSPSKELEDLNLLGGGWSCLMVFWS